MKYLITEKQLRMIKKYMKNFINENQIKGYDALEQFPFSDLPETYEEYKDNGFNGRVKEWGKVEVPIGGGTSLSINTKEQLRQFIDEFKKQYGDEPKFEILVSEKQIKIVNNTFNKNRESEQTYISSDEREWQDRRNRGDFNR